jgi:SAM-dependent methyltransferase
MKQSRPFLWLTVLICGVCSLWITGYAQEREPDVRFVPTPQEVVVEMLNTAKVTSKDIVYDLGCGDGRTVITAAKMFGARGIGVDIDPERIKESKENALKAGVADRVSFIEQDLFKMDFSKATVVFLYLLTELNEQLRPKLLQELKPGSRIVSHEFDMGDWRPDNTGMVRNVKIYYQPERPDTKDTYYYFWIVPADAAGTWRWTLSTSANRRDYTLDLRQKYQEISGSVKSGGRETPIADARLTGDKLSFTLKEDMGGRKTLMRVNGQITGNAIRGTVEVQNGSSKGTYAWTASRSLRPR